MHGRLLLAGFAALAAGPALAPADARAGTFTHVVCAHPETRVGTGLTSAEGLSDLGAGAGWRTTWDCPAGLLGSFSGIALKRASTPSGSSDPGAWRGLRYRVDRPGLRLERARFWRAISTSNGTTGEVRWGQHAATDLADPHAAPAHTSERGTWTTGYLTKGTNNATQLFSASNRVEPVTADDGFAVSVACAGPDTACSGTLSYSIFGITAVIADDAPPELRSAAGPLATADRIAGAPTARLELADDGAGLHRLTLTLDGQPAGTVDLAGGDQRCQDVNPSNQDPREFAYQSPCPTAREVDVALPLYEVADGEHRLTLSVEDAAGNATTVVDRDVVVDNHPSPEPVADEPPAVGGDAEPGGVLTASSGGWLRASALAYRWERCTANVCTTIPGAVNRTYAPVPDDVDSDVRVAVTAVNDIGEPATAMSRRVGVRDREMPAPADAATEPVGTPPPLASVPAAGPPADLGAVPLRPLFTPALGLGPASAPLARPAPRPNGRHASPHARLVIRLTRRGRVLRGRLVTAAGRPIGAARVQVATRCPRYATSAVPSVGADRRRRQVHVPIRERPDAQGVSDLPPRPRCDRRGGTRDPARAEVGDPAPRRTAAGTRHARVMSRLRPPTLSCARWRPASVECLTVPSPSAPENASSAPVNATHSPPT
jgi:hypothetical protein